MFILCFYQAVGVIKAAKLNQSHIKVAMFELRRLLFEGGKVIKDYEKVREKMKNEKTADRIAEWKDRTKNSKQQIQNPTPEAIQLQNRKFEQMTNESSMKIVKTTTSTQGDLAAAEWKRNTGSFEIVCSKYNSCRKRCNNNNRSINNQTYNCYCDDQCHFVYQDCCYDYERYCGKQHPAINKVQVLDRNMVSCIPGYEARGTNIWMVTKCSRGWLNKEVLYKCENASVKRGIFEVENIYQYLPVVDINNTVYRNALCAQCNNLENFTYFSLNITCSILPPSSLSSLQDILSFVSEYCVHSKIFSMPAENQARRYCNDLVVENCRTLGTLTPRNAGKAPWRLLRPIM